MTLADSKVWTRRLWGALALAACLGCGDKNPTEIAPGMPLPQFQAQTLEGLTVDSPSFIDRNIVLNFWATWCGSCRRETAELQKLADHGQAEVIGIAIDEEGASAVKPYIQKHKIEYPILLGDLELFQRLGGITLPYTLVLNPRGHIVRIYRGPTREGDIVRSLNASTSPATVGGAP